MCLARRPIICWCSGVAIFQYRYLFYVTSLCLALQKLSLRPIMEDSSCRDSEMITTCQTQSGMNSEKARKSLVSTLTKCAPQTIAGVQVDRDNKSRIYFFIIVKLRNLATAFLGPIRNPSNFHLSVI